MEASTGQRPPDKAEVTRPSPSQLRPLAVSAALLIGFGLPILPLRSLDMAMRRLGFDAYGAWGATDCALKVATVAAIVLVVIAWERLPLASVGLFKADVSDLILGLAAFGAVTFVGGISLSVVRVLLRTNPPVGVSQMVMLMQMPLWIGVVGAFASGVSEELAARGYGIERLTAATGSVVVAAALAYVADLAMHLPFWGWRYALAIAPSQFIFLSLYLWRRRLAPCIIAHILTDTTPFAIVALVTTVPAFFSPNFHDHRGDLLESEGHHDAAIVEYSIALRRNPRDASAHKGRAEAYWSKKQYKPAIADLDEAIRLDPKNAGAYEDRALSYYSTGDYGRADADLKRALQIDPSSGYAYSLRAYIDDARLEYDREVSDLGEAMSRGELDSDVYVRRATAYRLRRQYKPSVADLDEAIRLDPKNAGAYAGRARTCYATRDYDRAEADLKHALQIDPSMGYAYTLRAFIASQRGQGEVALADLGEAFSLGDHSSDVYLLRAYIRFTKQEYRREVEDLSEAIVLDPGRRQNYVNRASAYLFLGDTQQALNDLDNVIRADPKNSPARNLLAWTLSTNPNARVRDGRRAIALARQALADTGGKDAYLVDTLAAAYAEAGDFDQAIDSQQKAIAMLRQANDKALPGGRARLESYRKHHPYRETPQPLWDNG